MLPSMNGTVRTKDPPATSGDAAPAGPAASAPIAAAVRAARPKQRNFMCTSGGRRGPDALSPLALKGKRRLPLVHIRGGARLAGDELGCPRGVGARVGVLARDDVQQRIDDLGVELGARVLLQFSYGPV